MASAVAKRDVTRPSIFEFREKWVNVAAGIGDSFEKREMALAPLSKASPLYIARYRHSRREKNCDRLTFRGLNLLLRARIRDSILLIFLYTP